MEKLCVYNLASSVCPIPPADDYVQWKLSYTPVNPSPGGFSCQLIPTDTQLSLFSVVTIIQTHNINIQIGITDRTKADDVGAKKREYRKAETNCSA